MRLVPNRQTYDFIDIGASSGGSLAWAARTFGGTGIGVDMSEEKVERARAAGHDMMLADARDIDLPDGSVRYCVLMDFLEHLPSIDDAAAVLRNAERLARDFVFIALPHFDNEEMLRQYDLKRYYTDWSGHTLHLTAGRLGELLEEAPGENRVFQFGEMLDTFDRCIIPANAPKNSSFFDPGIFDDRPFFKLPRRALYERTFGVIVKNKKQSPNSVLMDALVGLACLKSV